jgi:hypothetical protein
VYAQTVTGQVIARTFEEAKRLLPLGVEYKFLMTDIQPEPGIWCVTGRRDRLPHGSPHIFILYMACVSESRAESYAYVHSGRNAEL